MAIFGRKTARQRLRRAARQSLTIPAFSAPVDCTPWVLGDLWPAELATGSTETATLADYLNTDLQRIAQSANEKLQAISRAGLVASARQAAEAQVINGARAFAASRVESTVRQLRDEAQAMADQPEPGGEPAPPEQPAHLEETQISEPADAGTNEPDEPESDEEQLRRLLEFVARQEPGLRWAVGTGEDGSTVLATDLAHGWIPSGIELPTGVRLLEPGRRFGNAAALLGTTTRSATYAPGNRLGSAAGCGPAEPSLRPRELPEIDDLGWVLAEATHWRDGLPRMVHTLAKAGAAGTGVADAEIDLLRVQLDTVRYQLLAQYPDPADIALLLNCMLLSATEGIATGDRLSANYHFAWFEAMSVASAGN